MTKKFLASVLAALVINFVFLTPTPAQAGKEAQRVYKVKHDVNKIGVGEEVRIKLRDETKLRGQIREIGEDYFVVADKKGDVTRLTFAQVKGLKIKPENPFSDPAVWLGIAFIPVLVGAAILARGK